jgi:uncharacterized protein (TIRG00374 family)
MRKFIVAVVLMLTILFVIGQFTELQTLIETIRRGDWRYLIIGLILEAAWLCNMGASYLAIYRLLGINEKIENTIIMSTAAYFLSVVAPSVGMSGAAVFITEARRRNYSPARATIAGSLYLLFDLLGFIVVLALGLFVLFRRNHLTIVEITASLIIVFVATVLALLLFLGLKSERAFGQALAWMSRVVNKIVHPFIHRDYLSTARAYEFARDASEGILELRKDPRKMLIPACLALVNKSLHLCIMFIVFLAFKVPISAGTVVAGYSISYLFLIVSPTPSGIGIVEGMMTIVLRSMYVTLEDAAVITVVYRGITLWVMVLCGMISFRMLGRLSNPIPLNHSQNPSNNIDAG